ncbi:MAG: hypothetical protein ACODAG_11760 [Myxococcota bacterium]
MIGVRRVQTGMVEQTAATVRLGRWLLAIVAALSLAGVGAEVAYYLAGLPGSVAAFLSLSFEKNLPTWYASCLLFSCAVMLGSIAHEVGQRELPHGPYWKILSGLFVYISLDEAVEIHEHLGGIFETGGVLYFSWVIPAAGVLVVLGLAFLPFLMRLPADTRRRFVIAGGVYVGGALLMELPLGLWTEQHGDDNLTYGLLDWIEETLELLGASLFLVALHAHRRSLCDGGEEAP